MSVAKINTSLRLAAAFLLLAMVAISAAQRPALRPPREPDKLKTGDPAPDFSLKRMDADATITLSDYQGKRPVALIFGSYT